MGRLPLCAGFDVRDSEAVTCWGADGLHNYHTPDFRYLHFGLIILHLHNIHKFTK